MILFAVLAVALSAAPVGPCEVATQGEIERVLGGATVPVPSSEIGEETAPSCIWATAKRKSEMKMSVWSDAELPVVEMKDARSYFEKLKADEQGAQALAGVGDAAFASFDLLRTGQVSGLIAVVKGDRLFTFEFGRVKKAEATAFVAAVMGRI